MAFLSRLMETRLNNRHDNLMENLLVQKCVWDLLDQKNSQRGKFIEAPFFSHNDFFGDGEVIEVAGHSPGK